MSGRPKVGVGLLVLKDGKVLMGKRTNAHGDGYYCGPGGHVEYGETIVECAKREALEETGLTVDNIRLLCVADMLAFPPDHYLDIAVAADWVSGEVQNLEPHKRESWSWYDLNALPSPMWPGEERYFESLKSGTVYFGTLR
ncbi:MAG: NUDIX domain-containing protein [Patescibacteria group bacterium]